MSWFASDELAIGLTVALVLIAIAEPLARAFV